MSFFVKSCNKNKKKTFTFGQLFCVNILNLQFTQYTVTIKQLFSLRISATAYISRKTTGPTFHLQNRSDGKTIIFTTS